MFSARYRTKTNYFVSFNNESWLLKTIKHNMNRFSNKVSVWFVNFLSESSYFELVLLRSVLFCFASKNNRFNFTKLISCVQSASLWAKQLIPSCKSILKPRTRFKSSFVSPECNNLLHDISYYLSDGMLHNSGLGRML